MSAGPSMRLRAILLFEVTPVIKGPLLWAALASLILLIVPTRFIMAGDIWNSKGELVGRDLRLNTVVVIGYSIIVFLTTLFTLCFCLDRAGNHYLRNNDLLILSRNVGRPAFYFAKIASVFMPALAYGCVAITLFWEELYRVAGVNLPGVFLLVFPLGLGTLCLVSLYFLMRSVFGNFLIFFLWILLLAVIYVVNLWTYYAGFLREGGVFTRVVSLLPQFGGIHVWSLGTVRPFFWRPESWHSLVNAAVWTAVSLAAGLFLFTRKRL